MCDYCKESRGVDSTPKVFMVKDIDVMGDKIGDLEVDIWSGKLSLWLSTDDNDITLAEAKINFCPMCGEKLP